MAIQQLICANGDLKSNDCKKAGQYSCKNCCLVVVYCGPECQKSHWPIHKIDCKSYIGKVAWTPDWVLKNRKPAFVQDGTGVPYGGRKYLWGNIPAFDILQLAKNEGAEYGGQSKLLFAASGDLRNVVETIAQIPSSYNKPISVTINDRDLDIVARNAILLLIAFVVDNVDEAIDCIIHVWYSAFIRKSDLEILQQRVRPLIQNVCEKIKSKGPASVLGKTWDLGTRSLRLVLDKNSWDSLLSFTNIPEGLTAEQAKNIRTAVTLTESRKDYRDRQLILQSSSRRIAKHRFWEDGLLLPFGSPRNEFQEPNPTFFQFNESWPMRDNADLCYGWSLKKVEDTYIGPATADIYGKLFYHVRSVLRAFLLRLSSLQVSFRLFQVDATKLPDHLEGELFSRIEVSNIADAGYLGLPRTIGMMVPLLEKPSFNPHATLVILLMNAVDENQTKQDQIADATLNSTTTKRLLKYLPRKGSWGTLSSYNPEVIKFSLARDSVATFDHIFDRFMKDFPFPKAAQLFGAEMKEKHTVIEKWPFRLKLRPGQPGAQEEFERLLGGGVSGKERYMEWKRIPTGGE